MEITIYALSDPRTSEVRYIGKTKNKIGYRLTQHLRDTSNSHKANWISALAKEGLKPIVSVIEICNESNWEERESFWIAHYGDQLTNLTSGGDGVHGHKQETLDKLAALGRNISDETRLKRSISAKLRVITDEWRTNMSIAASKRVRQPMSQATKDKIAAKAIGNKRAVGCGRSLETRQRMSASQLVACKTRKNRYAVA